MAALNATVQWEVETGGSDGNAGLYDSGVTSPGTDYTYGAGQVTYSYSDIVVGATTTQGTSVARPFVAADNGNGLNSTAGGTNGRFEMTSESLGTATFNASLGSATNTLTAVLGGALVSPALPEGYVVAGNIVNYESGTYSIASSSANVATGRLNLATSGSATARIRRIGYGSTRQDGGTKPIFQATASMGNSIVTFNNANSYNSLENVTVDGNSQTATALMTGQGRCNISDNCLFKNGTSTSGQNVTVGNNFTLMRFEITGCNTGTVPALGIESGGAMATIGYIHGNAARGVQVDNGPCTLTYLIVSGQTGANGYGLYMNASSNCVLQDCSLYNNAKDNVYLATANGMLICINVDSESSGGYGYNHNSAPHCLWLYNCAGYSNTSGNYPATAPQVLSNFQALTASGYNNPGAGDFSLNTLAGGGAVLRAAGIPGAYPGGLTTGYPDIGAWQGADNVAVSDSGYVIAQPVWPGNTVSVYA